MSRKCYYTVISSLTSLGKDRVQCASVEGFNVLVGMDVGVGSKGFLFLPDAVLTERACTLLGWTHEPRVRAQKFFKGTFLSEALFIPFNDGEGIDTESLYYTYEPRVAGTSYTEGKRKEKLVIKNFPEHVDTEQWKIYAENFMKNVFNPSANPEFNISLKMHGTSARSGYVLVENKLKWWQKAVNFFVDTFPTEQYRHVCGSRTKVFQGDYGSHHPMTRQAAHEWIMPMLSKDMVVYYELIGWGDGAWIMPPFEGVPYSYGTDQASHISELIYVYRITYKGKDLPASSVKGIAENVLKVRVPKLLARGYLNYDVLYEVPKIFEMLRSPIASTAFGGHTQEGLVMRYDDDTRNTPYLLKHKTPEFYYQEGFT